MEWKKIKCIFEMDLLPSLPSYLTRPKIRRVDEGLRVDYTGV